MRNSSFMVYTKSAMMCNPHIGNTPQTPLMSDKKIENIGIVIPAYKRPIETRQAIFSALHQSYKCKVFVSVKGYSEDSYKRFFLEEFAKEIEAGDLVLSFSTNKGQISNTLDCIRDADISDIDYFVKMDNDDVYLKQYVANVVDFLQYEAESEFYPDVVGTFSCNMVYRNARGDFFAPKREGYLLGPTICFSKKVVDILFKVEQGDYSDLEEIGLDITQFNNISDDRFVFELGKKLGGAVDYGKTDYLYINEITPSCWRGSDYISAANKSATLEGSFGLEEEQVLHVFHPGWSGYLIIQGERFTRENGDPGDVLEFDSEGIWVKWDKWGKEYFRLNPNKNYYIYEGESKL